MYYSCHLQAVVSIASLLSPALLILGSAAPSCSTE